MPILKLKAPRSDSPTIVIVVDVFADDVIEVFLSEDFEKLILASQIRFRRPGKKKQQWLEDFSHAC